MTTACIPFDQFRLASACGIWAAGWIVWSRERVAERLGERSRQLDLQREQTAALAVEVERARLAADLDAAARARLREMIDLAERGREIERELFPGSSGSGASR